MLLGLVRLTARRQSMNSWYVSSSVLGARRRILALTATRADFGKLEPLLRALEGVCDVELTVFVTGVHHLDRLGRTAHEVAAAGFRRIVVFDNGCDRASVDRVMTATATAIADQLDREPVDALLVHGDRIEPIAAALVATLRGVLVMHVEGGEVSGTVDEQLRHAISKIAHRHFVANAAARNRLIQLGEAPESIFVTGSPEVDTMRSPLPDVGDVKRRYEIPFERYAILSVHPVHYDQATLVEDTRDLFAAVVDSQLQFVVLAPNTDRGHEVITREIHRALTPLERCRVIPHVEFRAFQALLRDALVIVGNSSAGVREAPVFGVPAVNVGDRQQHRANARSVRTVPSDRRAILAAIRELSGQRFEPYLEFGDGDAARRFIEIVNTKQFWSAPLQKTFYGSILS
jgi:UDP-N-acetylglucosamine 2-epimerase (hydrolysing)